MTFCFSAFSINEFATDKLSSSKSDLPIFPPLLLMNVFAIAPPIIILSTKSINFSITFILSETFAPPSIAVKGLFSSNNTLFILFNSSLTKSPIQ